MFKGFFIAAIVLGLAGPAMAQSPAFTAEQAQRGADLYVENCLKCHGANLSDGQVGAPLRGSLFKDKWTGKPLSEIMTFMTMTMPPENPGYFYPDEYADMLAYILQRNDFQPGDKALPEKAEALKDIALTW
jgi:mono/diheme cytochrome c family protein